MNETAVVMARAKINIVLDIIGKRNDGYHDIRTIMQTVDLHDAVTIKRMSEKDKNGIKLFTNSDKIPTDKRNLAYKAAMRLKKEYSIDEGIEIIIDKNIPVAAGLAGGSSDCAAVLKGMKEVFSLPIEEETLLKIAMELGADVPYCLKGGTYLAEGIGEKLKKISDFPFSYVLIAKPDIDVSTAWVYKNLDLNKKKKSPDIEKMITDISEKNVGEIYKNMINVLEEVTIGAHPVIEEIKIAMKGSGAMAAMMSGSGPSVFGFYDDKDSCVNGAANISSKFGVKECFVTSISN